ncbi:MAG: sensor histidine kinase, partial [Chloroflexia bacterium]|nr:sensor histidine kinase [Chloroflexia bacterium]
PPWRRRHFSRFLPLALFLAWIGALLHLWIMMDAPRDVVFSAGDLLARYLLGLPAAALSCLGLIEQRREVHEAGFPRIARYLLWAAVSLGIFGLVGVLLGVAGPLFPAEWLAYPAVLYIIGVFVPILRALDGVAMAFFTSRALEVFEAETEALVNAVERRNLLLVDRERIGRELHDGIIQSLYAAGLRLEDAYRTLDRSPEQAGLKIQEVMGSLNQVIREMREYIFDLQESRSEGNLVEQLAGLIRELRLDSMLESQFIVRGPRCDVPPERAAQLCQIAQEALSNVMRHARAEHILVRLLFLPNQVRLQIEDDGRGFVPELVLRGGNHGDGLGLRNMCERATLLGGTLQVNSAPGKGTLIELGVPCGCRKGHPEAFPEIVDDGACTPTIGDRG